MKNKKLYIIGNGFDIAHNLKTRYLDFMIWLYNNDKNTFDNLNNLFLESLDRRRIDIKNDSVIESRVENDYAYKILKEQFSDPLILYKLWLQLEDYMYCVFLDRELKEVESEKKALLDLFQEEEYGPVIELDLSYISRPWLDYFNKLIKLGNDFYSNLLTWVEEIDCSISDINDCIKNSSNKNGLKMNVLPNDFFSDDDFIINFNYSKTIEILYSKKPYHIHSSCDSKNPPIMGHNQNISDLFAIDDKELILVEKFYKDIDSIIANNEVLFNKLHDFQEIIVIGLSYSKTDYPYIEKISSMLPNAKWTLYYYSESDYNNAENYINKLKDIGEINASCKSLKEYPLFTKVVEY